MSTVTITPVALRANQFASAWTNVARAENNDVDDPFHRTVIVEVFEDLGVRLIATNGYLMLWSWVPVAPGFDDDEEPAPELTETPDVTLWVRDKYHLIHAACKNIARQAKSQPDARVVLSVGVMEDNAQPTLDPDLDRIGLILAARDQRELAPLIIGHSTPDWRKGLDEFDPATVDVTAYSIDVLKRIGGLSNDMGYVRLTHQGDGRPVLLHADTEPPVDGLMVPVKLSNAVPAEETAWADDVINRINEAEGYTPPEMDPTSLDERTPPDEFSEMMRLAEEDARQALAEQGELTPEDLAALADGVRSDEDEEE